MALGLQHVFEHDWRCSTDKDGVHVLDGRRLSEGCPDVPEHDGRELVASGCVCGLHIVVGGVSGARIVELHVADDVEHFGHLVGWDILCLGKIQDFLECQTKIGVVSPVCLFQVLHLVGDTGTDDGLDLRFLGKRYEFPTEGGRCVPFRKVDGEGDGDVDGPVAIHGTRRVSKNDGLLVSSVVGQRFPERVQAGVSFFPDPFNDLVRIQDTRVDSLLSSKHIVDEGCVSFLVVAFKCLAI